MKKIIFCILILLFPSFVKAECTSQEISRLKTLATKISVTYDYEEKEYYALFSATFHNINKDLKVVDIRTNKTYTSNNNFYDITLNNIFSGQSSSIKILSNLKNCKDKEITVKYYSVPSYNSYYKDPLCEGNETKKYCQKWINTNSLSYRDFVDSFKEETETIEKEEENKTMYSILSDLFVKYYYVLFGSIIIICLTIIIIKVRKDRFNF